MPRVKSTPVTKRRRKKVLKLAKGYYGSKHTLYKVANQAVMKSWSCMHTVTVVTKNVIP